MASRKKKQFQCKYEKCPYSQGSSRFFDRYQYLKQHYDKVHSEKILKCSKCPKSFATLTLLNSHLRQCGLQFKCNTCNALYKSYEALLTHTKRKKHDFTPLRDRKLKEGSVSGGEKCLINIPPGSQLIILQPNSQVPIELTRSTTATTSTGVQSTPVCSMHVMAAVALSELASGVSQPVEKREFSTQTESSTPDVWLNLVQEGADRDRIHTSGTQTEEVHWTSTMNTEDAPGSPWLGLSAAETQTVDEDIVLRPFNLCNIQTQTPWNDLSDGEDVTESQLAHTETQTLLSSFFIEPSQTELSDFNVKPLCKQTSEDAGTDPMEKWDF